MNLSFIHRAVPDGAYKARYESEFYRLLPRKRQMYDGNYEVKTGMRYLIWSRYARVYYERHMDPSRETEENIQYFVQQGMLHIWPTEEDKEEIKADVANEKLNYWRLMYRRQTELDFDRQKRGRPTGNGDQWLRKYRREQIDKLKIKYRKR